MPQIKVPRLYLNRCGVFCFRLKRATEDRRFSLGTKCPHTANIMALQLNAEIERSKAMGFDSKKLRVEDIVANLDLDNARRYRIDLNRGVFEADGPEDHAMMMDAVERIGLFSERSSFGREEKGVPSLARQVEQPPTPAILKTRKLKEVAEDWLAERAAKNGARTVYAKRCHFNDFAKRVTSDVEINAINKATLVGYKAALLNAGQTGKTIDNKLMSLNDLFAYALAHGEYTISNESPVSGLFVLSKRERKEKNQPYDQFSRQELSKIFDPKSFISFMNAPDLFWAPLIAVYTGLRISEAAQLRCQDFGENDGYPYLHVYRSKTPAGMRNLPLPKELVELGFLDYVQEVRAAGAGRIFPHRRFVNGTYSKRLGEVFGEYLTDIGIKRDRLSFHSFRATVITAMVNADVPVWKSMAIAGHQPEGTLAASIGVHFGYVRDLPKLKPVMDSFSWGLDLAALKYAGRFKMFVADKKNWKPGENGVLGAD